MRHLKQRLMRSECMFCRCLNQSGKSASTIGSNACKILMGNILKINKKRFSMINICFCSLITKYKRCDNLEDVYDTCPSHDTKIILKDFNAKLRLEGISDPTVGQFSLHTSATSNCMMVFDFAAARSMVICIIRFQYLDIHKASNLASIRF